MAQKKKACKKCHLLVENSVNTCPVCKNNQFSTSYHGRIIINDPKKSKISDVLGIDAPGEYALKVR